MQRRPSVILVKEPAATVAADAKRRFGSLELILLSLAALGFCAMLALPAAAACILRAAKDAAAATKQPVDLESRTVSFFLAVLGIWGFALYVWTCCTYSASKGLSRKWGLLALPAITSFICLACTGDFGFGFLSLLGAGGIVVPLILPADRVLLATNKIKFSDMLLARLRTRMTLVWAFGLFVGVLGAYGNSFRGGMTLDNRYIIQEYFQQIPAILPKTDMFSWSEMLPVFFQNDYWWPKGISGLYRPVAVFTFWANYAFNHWQGNAPLDTFQYHVVNFFLHWITVVLAFVLIRQLCGRSVIAFFSALLLAMHPITTESVSNIIGRSDIFAAITVFACLSLHIRGTKAAAWSWTPWLALLITIQAMLILFLIFESSFSTPPPLEVTMICLTIIVPVAGFFLVWGAKHFQWTRLPWIAAMAAVLAVGLFSKESAIAVVGIIIVYDIIYRWTLEDLRYSIPSLILLSVIAAFTLGISLHNGQFGALGLSEGLKPVLIIMLVGSLLAAIGLTVVLILWTVKKPLTVQLLAKPWIDYFLPYAAVIPPILLWLWARSVVFASASPPETPFLDNPIRGLGFFAARMTAGDVFLRLFSLAVYPVKLSCDYSFNQIPLFYGHLGSADTWLALAGWLFIGVMCAAMILCYRKQKLFCFMIAFYLLAYLPTSNFLIVIGSIMAERFMYLPLIAFSTCLVLGIDARARRGQSETDTWHFFKTRALPANGLMVAMALCYGIRSSNRNEDWLSDVTLWNSAIKVSPVSFRSYQSDAYALYEQFKDRLAAGVYASNPDLRNDDIDILYKTDEKARLIVDPLPKDQNSSRLYLHLGMYYGLKAQTVGHFLPNGTLPPDDPGIEWFRKAEEVLQFGAVVDRAFNVTNRKKELDRKIRDPDSIQDVGLPPLYFSLGNTYAHLGEWDKAIQTFQYMQHLDPANADSYVGLASVYFSQNRFDAASSALFQALVLDNKRSELWGSLSQTLSRVTTKPAILRQNGQVRIDASIPEVRSVICIAYQNFVTTFRIAKKPANALDFRNTAVTGWKFPEALFDDNAADDVVPVPPPPD